MFNNAEFPDILVSPQIIFEGCVQLYVTVYASNFIFHSKMLMINKMLFRILIYYKDF